MCSAIAMYIDQQFKIKKKKLKNLKNLSYVNTPLVFFLTFHLCWIAKWVGEMTSAEFPNNRMKEGHKVVRKREVGRSIAGAVECWLGWEGHQLVRGCAWNSPALPWEQCVSQDAWFLCLAWPEGCPASEPSRCLLSSMALGSCHRAWLHRGHV